MRKKVVDTINEDLFKEVATGIYAISSKQIEVFPCVSRGEKYNTDSIIASEFNITHIPSVGVKSNYMIKCDGTGTEVVVGGYVFRVGVTRSVLDTQGIKAFGIKLVIPGTEVDNAQAILASIDDGSAKGLDTAEGYFYGLAFCKEEKPAGFNAYTGINETLPIVAVSGDYTSDHWTKISIGNTNRNVGTITSVNGKTPATTNGAVTIAASDISTNRADETVQTALTNLSTAVNTAQSTADTAYDMADNAIRIAKNKSTVSASTTSYTETGVNIAKSLLINGNKWNLPEGGGGTAGVSSIGGATGAITLGSGLSISGRTLSTSKTIPVVTLNGTVTANPGFFAPTTYGTKGQVLISGGTANPPTWDSVLTKNLTFIGNGGKKTIAYNGSSDISVSNSAGIELDCSSPTIVYIKAPYAPSSAGTSGQVWTSTGSTPAWTDLPGKKISVSDATVSTTGFIWAYECGSNTSVKLPTSGGTFELGFKISNSTWAPLSPTACIMVFTIDLPAKADLTDDIIFYGTSSAFTIADSYKSKFPNDLAYGQIYLSGVVLTPSGSSEKNIRLVFRTSGNSAEVTPYMPVGDIIWYRQIV